MPDATPVCNEWQHKEVLKLGSWKSNLDAEKIWSRFMKDSGFLFNSTMKIRLEVTVEDGLAHFEGLQS